MSDYNQKRKVLIVDDSPSNLMILGEVLTQEYEVYVASSGRDALKKAALNMPDIILLDIMMPDIDGYEVCRRLKADEATEKIPVIFITSMNSEEDEVKGLSFGAVDYITKPFRLPIVLARIKTHLELKAKTDILENISSRDGLTGIFNRRRFDEGLTTEWKKAMRQKQPLSLIILDLDFFKLYNDNYGHLAGDECLKAVAETISATIKRAGDLAARYGGEEFVVLLPNTPQNDSVYIAEKIKKNVEELQIEHKYSLIASHITISLGVSTVIPEQNKEHQTLIDMADKALYQAKQAGKNTVRYFGTPGTPKDT